MKELFRERDFTRVGYYQSILESDGIPTFVRNQDLTSMMTEFPIPEFFPALCVMNDEDYSRAIELLRKHVMEDASRSTEEIECTKCGEKNPGNFDVCWSCGETIAKS